MVTQVDVSVVHAEAVSLCTTPAADVVITVVSLHLHFAHVCSKCLWFRVEDHGLWQCGDRIVSLANSRSLLTHPCCCKVSAVH